MSDLQARPKSGRGANFGHLGRTALGVFIAAAFASGCVTTKPDLRTRYLRSIEDAALPEPSEVHDLWRVDASDPKQTWRTSTTGVQQVQVVAVMSAEAQQRFYSTEEGQLPGFPVLWVTLGSQLQDACRSFEAGDATGLQLRVKQYLGLDPDRTYDTVVVLWVEGARLFRPCPDPDPSKMTCGFETPEDARVPDLDDYKKWFEALYPDRYRVEGGPWTRLGYTYDWGGEGTEVGASEFLVAPSTTWNRVDVQPLEAFCANPE